MRTGHRFAIKMVCSFVVVVAAPSASAELTLKTEQLYMKMIEPQIAHAHQIQNEMEEGRRTSCPITKRVELSACLGEIIANSSIRSYGELGAWGMAARAAADWDRKQVPSDDAATLHQLDNLLLLLERIDLAHFLVREKSRASTATYFESVAFAQFENKLSSQLLKNLEAELGKLSKRFTEPASHKNRLPAAIKYRTAHLENLKTKFTTIKKNLPRFDSKESELQSSAISTLLGLEARDTQCKPSRLAARNEMTNEDCDELVTRTTTLCLTESNPKEFLKGANEVAKFVTQIRDCQSRRLRAKLRRS